MCQAAGTTLLTESQSRTRIAGVPLLQVVFGGAAMVFGLALCGLLVHWSGQGIGHWFSLVRGVELPWAGVALAGMAVNLMLAAQKWRRVEACLSGTSPSYRYAVGVTAIGQGLGQFLPTPIASVIARGLGNRASKRSGRHGAFASAWEQLFDLGAAALLTGPALVALARGSEAALFVGLVAAAVVGESGAVVLPRLVVRLARMEPVLATPALCRLLWRLSFVRVGVLMLVTIAIGQAMKAPITPWQIAAAVPPVILAAVLSFVPAGLGVNELSFVGLFGMAGVALPLSTAFALVNRVVQVLIAALLGLAGCALLVSSWVLAGNPGDDAQCRRSS
jgi:hypothetical protein